MTQTVSLAAGKTATTVDVAVATPTIFTVFAASGRVPQNAILGLSTIANGIVTPLASLSPMVDNGRVLVDAVCTVRITRPDISAYGVDVGVTTDA